MRLNRLRRRRGGVIDRRGQSYGGGLGGRGGLGGGGFPVGGGVLGGGAIGIVLLVVIVALQVCGSSGGFDVPGLPGDLGGANSAPSGATGPAGSADSLRTFVDAVSDDVQITWDREVFQPAGRSYRYTDVVLFTQRTRSGCGVATADIGPFYCPADHLVYLDGSFFRELDRRFGAPGDFAQAYVIAHEFGHHVQSLLGIEADVQRESSANPDQANELSVRLELQADCFAGVWAKSAYGRGALEAGDVQEALDAAAAVGDDRLQQQAQGRVDPDTFTHGTSAQRMDWFRRGFDSGDPNDCDTFAGDI
jgi:predicted metalloprotease